MRVLRFSDVPDEMNNVRVIVETGGGELVGRVDPFPRNVFQNPDVDRVGKNRIG